MTEVLERGAEIRCGLQPVDTWNPAAAAPEFEFDYIDIASVDRDRKAVTSWSRIKAADAPSRARQLVRTGDILVSTVRPNLNAVAMVPPELDGAVASTGFCVLRTQADVIERRYLFHWVRSPQFVASMTRQATGASYPAITDRIVKRSRMPLPILAEQRRTADVLDKANLVKSARMSARDNARNLAGSIFFDIFGDPNARSNRWPRVKLGDAALLDRGRSRHRPRDAAFLYGGPYPFVQTGDIANSDGFIVGYEQTYSAAGLAQSKLWPEGTLCITIAANIAKTAILTFPACFPDSIVGLVPGERLVTEYVRYWFVGMERCIDAAATQVAQKNINLEVLRKLEIQIPPIALQRRFADQVRGARRLWERYDLTCREANELANALANRAFLGEL